MRKIIILVMVAIMAIGIMPNAVLAASSDQPQILRVEQSGKELSKDQNNPTKLPYHHALKFIGNDACKNMSLDIEFYIDGNFAGYGLGGAEFDENSEYNYHNGYNSHLSNLYDHTYALKYVVFDNNDYDNTVTEGPTYYVILLDNPSSDDELVNGVIEDIRLTANQLIIETNQEYSFLGPCVFLLKDKTIGKERKLYFFAPNPNILGINTNRIVYSGLSIDSNHIYEITIPKASFIGFVLNSNYNNYNKEFVSELIVEGSKTAADNDQPQILCIEQLGKELSQDRNNPTKLPYYHALKFIGNDACKNKSIVLNTYIEGNWTNGGIIAEFDKNSEYNHSTGSRTYMSDLVDHAYELKYVIFDNDQDRNIMSESPTYYIINLDESSSMVELVNGVVKELRLTNNQLIIEVKQGYIFDGSIILLKDKTTGEEQELGIDIYNTNVSGVLSNRIIYSNLSIDSKHIYEITIPKHAIISDDLSDLNVSKFKYSREFVSELIVEGSKTFEDVPNDYWAYPYIKELTEKRVVGGYEDGSFRPEAAVTRSEFAKMMLSSLQIPLNTNSNQSFTDVPNSDWAFNYIETIKPYLTGYKNGGEYYFKGSDPAVREDMAVALVKAMDLQNENVDLEELKTIFSDYTTISPNLQKYVLIAYKNQLISGYPDGTFGAQKTITRAEATALLSKVYKSNAMEKVTFDF